MEQLMTFMLIRFAIIAAVVVALITVGFTVAIILKRQGRQDQMRHFTAPIVRGWANRQPRGRGIRGSATRTAARSVLNYLDDKEERDRR